MSVVRRKEIVDILGVREVDRHEKYLSIPTIIGRSKKGVFAFLEERMWKKLNGRKKKNISSRQRSID